MSSVSVNPNNISFVSFTAHGPVSSYFLTYYRWGIYSEIKIDSSRPELVTLPLKRENLHIDIHASGWYAELVCLRINHPWENFVFLIVDLVAVHLKYAQIPCSDCLFQWRKPVCEVCEARPPITDPHWVQTTLIFYYRRHIKINNLPALWNEVFRMEDLRCFTLPAEPRSQMSASLISPNCFIGPFLLLPRIVSHRLSGQRCSCIKLGSLHLYSLAVSLFGCLEEAVKAS